VLDERLREVDTGFAEIVRRIPPRKEPSLPPDWLHLEMIERYRVLSHAGIEKGANVLEVGAGAHAIATVPLAYMVGEAGRVVAVEIERWACFDETVRAAGLKRRIIALATDARRLPFPFESFDLAAIVHGIRSLRNRETIGKVLREMLRVAPRIFVAESLPMARTKAQEAHLAMYNLREEIFEARTGKKDDLRYVPLEALVGFVKGAGGKVVESKVLDVGLPHYLAFLPRAYVERIEDEDKRADLLRRWEAAKGRLDEHGAEHPPVGIVVAVRRGDEG
jgi:precorrin-6B methylase 2